MSTDTGTARERETADILGKLTAEIEPFDSFWEGPEDIEKGYSKFNAFYKDNYLSHLPAGKEANILVVSCGPGYFVEMLKSSLKDVDL